MMPQSSAAMADSAGGWQTVLPSAHNRVGRLDRAQLEAYERQALQLWAEAEGDWSGWYVFAPIYQPRSIMKKRTSLALITQ